MCPGESGSQGLAGEKPPFGAFDSHAIGVRQPSRPLYSGQKRMP
jgi:hypothetical protein